jgi:3-hydroxy-9,10-secoandrosta-1,3,5(10)-triene-9,17-dione monooxygenase reductase component
LSDPTPLDSKHLRQVFGRFCTGVTAVCTTDAGGKPIGITVNSFSSVSLDPPLILFCITRDADTLPALQDTRRFSVNILSAAQQELSNRLAKKGGAEKMAGVATHVAVTGAPVLADTLGWLDCEVYAFYEGGDHLIVVGKILAAQAAEPQPPLLYFQSAYRTLAATP